MSKVFATLIAGAEASRLRVSPVPASVSSD